MESSLIHKHWIQTDTVIRASKCRDKIKFIQLTYLTTYKHDNIFGRTL